MTKEIAFCEKKILAALEKVGSNLPHLTKDGCWTLSSDEDWEMTTGGYWTGGFWAGCLWLLYDLTKKTIYKREGYEVIERLASRSKGKGHHDLGFLFFPSFCMGYRITEDPYLRKIALEAATALREIFCAEAGVIPIRKVKFGELGCLAIDTMMNLPLLWWAYKETGEVRFKEIAISHSDVSARYLIRDDGSTVHLIEFQTLPFGKTKSIRLQGYSPDSCWSRGLAWAIYGFTFAYGATGKRLYLDCLTRMAKFYQRNTRTDGVPWYDLMDPDLPNVPRDSSAAAIVASALLEVDGYPLGNDTHETCGDLARTILSILTTKYLTHEGDGLLSEGCFHRPQEIGVNCSMIVGDYYYLEALWKLQSGEKVTHFAGSIGENPNVLTV